MKYGCFGVMIKATYRKMKIKFSIDLQMYLNKPIPVSLIFKKQKHRQENRRYN